MARTITITVNGSPIGEVIWDADGRTGVRQPGVGAFDGKIFHVGSGGSSVGETVSVLMIEPGDRVRWKPHSPVRTVIHAAWVLGAIALTTDDNLRWYFGVTGDGWPTVERVIEETRPG